MRADEPTAMFGSVPAIVGIRLALVAPENIIRSVIAVPRIDAIDRIAIRQRCFGDDDPEHLAFSGPLELEDVG